jgi:16S rRNA (uracil1498-N3)-methyltransferase
VGLPLVPKGLAVRRFQVPYIPAPNEPIELDEQGSHHLLTVLRMSRGSRIRVFDGEGNHAEATLADVVDKRAILRVAQILSPLPSPPPVHLLIGIPKRPAMDLAIRMATEAGVQEIHPMLCERSVPRGDRDARWRKICESACQQSGRTDIPLIHPLRPVREALRLPDEITDRRIALPNSPAGAAASKPSAIAIGPEGGFTSAEVQLALSMGYTPVGLGPFILRTDTAAVVAVAQAVGDPRPR